MTEDNPNWNDPLMAHLNNYLANQKELDEIAEEHFQANSQINPNKRYWEVESRLAFDFAEENDLWINDIYDLGISFSCGVENTNVVNVEEGFVYKSNNLMCSKSIINLLNRLQIYNQLFPETKYNLVGLTGIYNGINRQPYIELVVKQQLLAYTTPANPDEIANYMKFLGFVQTGDSSFKNDQYTISDLYPRNVLKDESGNIYVVDCSTVLN